KAEEAGALDGLGQFTLLLRRHRGDAARHDLAALGDVTLQQLHILVVDLRRVGAGERAGLAAAEKGAACAAGGCECHGLTLLLAAVFVARATAFAAVAAAVAAITAVAPVTAIATRTAVVAVGLAHHRRGAFLE